jgi:hypothetical protein
MRFAAVLAAIQRETSRVLVTRNFQAATVFEVRPGERKRREMPDYGHDIQFGYFLSPDAADAQAVEGPVDGSQPAARS